MKKNPKRRFDIKQWNIFKPLDSTLLALLALLSAFGLLILYSAAGESYETLTSQVVHLCIAFVTLCLCANIKPEAYETFAPYFYCGGVLLLLVVMGIGHVDKGARRWLDLGLIRIQPSEMMKLILPITLAAFLAPLKKEPRAKEIVIAIALIALPFLLVIKQPDLGTAIMIAASGAWVIFLCGIGIRYLLIAGASILTITPIGWHFLHNYQKKRILTFLNPEQDPLGTGYHIIQSKIAIGSGGILGKGYLHGTQAHLHFLPEHTTDFIYAVIGEEFGLLGCVFILGLFFALSLRCIWMTTQTQNYFSRYLITAISASFLLEGLVNIGMVTGLLPVVGVPLPFVSYGGSALLTLGAGFGIIMSLQSHRTMW